MSGIEVVGFLASASQLVLYSIKITTCLSDIWQRVQDAPLKVRQHLDQIRHLISTARLVEEHHLLQTAHVLTHIKATLEQAKSLSAILEQLKKDYSRGSIRRVWKILKATKEKEILASFDRLEKEKSALLLCISVAQTDLLGQGIQKLGMAGKQESLLSVPLEDGDREDNQTYTNNNAVRSALRTSSGQEVNDLYTSNKQLPRKEVPVNKMAKEKHCGSSSLPDTPGKNYEGPSSGIHHNDDNRTSTESTQQIDGEHCGSSSLPDSLGKNRESSSSGNRTSTKSTQQINGELYGSLRPQDSLGKNHESSSSGRRHDYNKPISTKTAQQINGDLSKSYTDYGPKCHYNEPRAEDHSQQLNGDVRDPELFKMFLNSRCQPEYPYGKAVITLW